MITAIRKAIYPVQILHAEYLNPFSFLTRILDRHEITASFLDISMISEKSRQILKTRILPALFIYKPENRTPDFVYSLRDASLCEAFLSFHFVSEQKWKGIGQWLYKVFCGRYYWG